VDAAVGNQAARDSTAVHPVAAAALPRKSARIVRGGTAVPPDDGESGLGWPGPAPDGTGVGWPADRTVPGSYAG
jgi:hypothetical protein